jgi:hypothetical protein
VTSPTFHRYGHSPTVPQLVVHLIYIRWDSRTSALLSSGSVLVFVDQTAEDLRSLDRARKAELLSSAGIDR